MSFYRSLAYSIKDFICTLTLLGPGKGNAMGPEFWDELPLAMDEINENSEIKVIILKGSGEHFSFGLDLLKMMPKLGDLLEGQMMAEKRLKLKSLVKHMQSGFLKMHQSPKPVIAAIHGWCVGGGLNMISAADIRLCSSEAKFSLRETRLAITPDIGGLQFLPTIIGQGFTRELAFTAKDFDAKYAEKMGLVNNIFATPEKLFEEANNMAKQIVENFSIAVQGAKEVLNYCQDKSIASGLDFVATWNSAFLQSEDFNEMLTAGLEKRKPNFK
jgi:enoyl-CoA hydratase